MIPEKERISNWLAVVFSSPVDQRVSEIFYFDFKDNQFFSILVMDYFLFDENWSIDPSTVTSYTREELFVLADRMKRIETNDESILYIPPKGITDEEQIGEAILEFLETNQMDLSTASVWLPSDENSSITFNIDEPENEVLNSKVVKKKWWKFW